MTSDGPREALGERPDGPGISPIFHDMMLRRNVVLNHVFAEGKEVPPNAVHVGYDRAEHPWLHGRRAHDLIERGREVIGRE